MVGGVVVGGVVVGGVVVGGVVVGGVVVGGSVVSEVSPPVVLSVVPWVLSSVPSVVLVVLSVVLVVSPVLSPVGVLSSFPPQAVNAKSIDIARSNAMIFFILFLPPIIKKVCSRSHTPEKCDLDLLPYKIECSPSRNGKTEVGIFTNSKMPTP